MEVTISPFDLELELAQIVDLFWPQASAKSTVFRLKYPSAVPRWFNGDGPRIRQIISNLTSNAVKFTEGGEIEIDVEGIDGNVRVSVRDTGAGIPKESLPQLFCRFTQVGTAVNHGTGLGSCDFKTIGGVNGG
jgi:signal transduction histidine kinase